MTPLDDASGSRAGRILVLVGIVTLAVNLRPAAVSVGPVLDEISTTLGMTPTTAGVLTTLPVIAFALFGSVAPALAARLGVHRLTLASLGAVALGLGLRSQADSVLILMATSLLALSGMATANVMLPSLVKLHFPTRVGTVTALYTTALAIGLTSSLTLTVPIASQFGDEGWRVGLATWAVAALIAALPWLALIRHDRRPSPPRRTIRLVDVARTRLGWAMALFFGLQSLQAYAVFGWLAQVYRDAGFSPSVAGLLVGVVAGVSIPMSLWVPAAAGRRDDQRPLMLALMVCFPAGYLGLIFAPVGGAVLWVLLIGIGCCVFPLVLTLIGLRARTPQGTAALSGFTQSAGYLLSAIGPLGMGVLYDVTGGWTVPLLALIALSIPQLYFGLAISRPQQIEDQLR